jgi:hypothetical protein
MSFSRSNGLEYVHGNTTLCFVPEDDIKALRIELERSKAKHIDRIADQILKATIKKRETKHLIPRAVGEAFLLQPVLDVRAKKFSGVGKVIARAVEMPD